jgi:hypothetical protein
MFVAPEVPSPWFFTVILWLSPAGSIVTTKSGDRIPVFTGSAAAGSF